jgi:phosphate transport system substrate-binding protein
MEEERMKARRVLPLVTIIATLLLVAPLFAVDLDPKIGPYKKVSGVTGNLKSIGSDT